MAFIHDDRNYGKGDGRTRDTRKMVSFPLTPDEEEQLDKLAKAAGLSRAEFIRRKTLRAQADELAGAIKNSKSKSR